MDLMNFVAADHYNGKRRKRCKKSKSLILINIFFGNWHGLKRDFVILQINLLWFMAMRRGFPTMLDWPSRISHFFHP